MTTAEIQAPTPTAVRMPATSHVPGNTAVRGMVIDCPAYAWDESDQPAILDLRERHGSQWVSDFREDLDLAAYDLIRDHLLVAWRALGFEPEFTDDKAAYETASYTPAPTDPPNETYWRLWNEAANGITADELVAKANLTAYAR